MSSKKGIDVSYCQKGLNLQDVKNSGNEFVIVRAGYTGYGTGKDCHVDNCFENFYNQAKNVNLPVGAYWYSCANTYEKGVNEANYMYSNCLINKQFEYPIYIDVEDVHWQRNNKNGVTDAIIGFCETLENKGYFVGVYASASWYRNNIKTSRLKAYTKWVAAYNDVRPDFQWNAFDIWQNSSSGKIGNMTVDTDISYRDLEKEIKNAGLNGFTKNTSTQPQYYMVVKGDNLTKIANKFGISVEKIVSLNNIKNKNLIYAGQSLRVK